jgi:pilus assembly protein CpaF
VESHDLHELLSSSFRAPSSRITVSGEPGAGKTTLLAALLAAAPASHCVRACEEIRELAVPITHGSYYEVRPPALDGTGEITL